MVLAWVIIILLITAPLWIWGIGLLILKKWEKHSAEHLSPEQRKRNWEQIYYGR